jgi:hypothetical protein
MAQLDHALYDFKRLTGVWPASLNALKSVVQVTPANALLDGWQRPFVIVFNTNAPTVVRIVSFGEDGLPGGVAQNSDIEQILD